MPSLFSPTHLQVVSDSATTVYEDTSSADAIWINYADADDKWVLSSGVILKSGKQVNELGLDLTPATVGGNTIKLILIGGTGVQITPPNGVPVPVARGEMVVLMTYADVHGAPVYPHVISFESNFSRFDVLRPADDDAKGAKPLACTEHNCSGGENRIPPA